MVPALWVALGGALGSVSRYALSGVAMKILGSALPYGTLVVNLVGSFGAGLILGSVGNTVWVAPVMRPFLLTGFLGGFTTFSAFSLETIGLFRDGQVKLALINILLNNVIGLGLAFAGYALAKGLSQSTR